MKQQISSFQFIWLMVWLILGTGVLTLPAAFNDFAPYQDGWICVLLIMLIPLIMSALAYIYVHFAAWTSLLIVSDTVFGRFGGVIVKMWFIIWLYICACTIGREFAIFIEQNFLPSTPIYIVCALIALPAGYAVHTGIENIARVTVILSMIVMLALVLNFALIITKVHGSYMYPVLQHGFGPVFEASIYPWAFTSELVIAFLLVPVLRSPKQLPRNLLWAGLLIISIASLLEFTCILTLGPVSMYKAYPVFSAVRLISIGPLIQRIEPLYVVLVIATIFIKLSIFIHTLCRSIQETVPIETDDERSIAWYISLLVWSGSVFFFHDEVELSTFILKVFPSYTFTMVIAVAIVCTTVVIRSVLGIGERPLRQK